MQLSVAVRNARLDSVESTMGVSAVLQIRSGAAPTDCSSADAGTLLVSIPLPADWMSNAATGAKAKLGTWSANAAATGTAGHFRVKDSGLTACHIQGSITVTGGGGDMTLDNTSIASGQSVVVNTFTLTDGNA